MLFSQSSAKLFSVSAIAAGLLACASFSPPMARAQSPNASDHFRVLLQYPNPTDAGGPTARLLRDDEGILYGVGGGGNDNDGVVFKLSPGGQETVLYSFNGTDGSYPKGGLVRDADGNLYGTTAYGGPKGYGTVFKLTPDGVFTVLHKFHGAPDGATPRGDLLLGADGNIYGTTTEGGTGCPNPYGPTGCGTVFKITPAGKESILYRFTDSPDGAHPEAGLVADADGNLYGATGQGGIIYAREFALGTVFRVTPDGQETVLYSFNGSAAGDGQNPDATLIWDEFGNLLGTTTEGGPNGGGTVFRLSLTGVESVLYSFPTSSTDGYAPNAGLVRDRDGNLFGTTVNGGNETNGCGGSGCGTVFRLTPNNAETIIHSFIDTGNNGCVLYSGLTAGRDRTLYGSTLFCGTTGNGTIFAIRPNGDPH
ncbi:MAG TPA: choice-of-anchor tandem repeat GloVer-containing protein [Acidobacteriaceae bacterium]